MHLYQWMKKLCHSDVYKRQVYIVYGGGQIWCVELEKDLSAVKPGTKRKLIDDAGLVKGCLAEGSHVYKMNGYYYIFIITWPPHRRRTQLCYRSEALDGERCV